MYCIPCNPRSIIAYTRFTVCNTIFTYVPATQCSVLYTSHLRYNLCSVYTVISKIYIHVNKHTQSHLFVCTVCVPPTRRTMFAHGLMYVVQNVPFQSSCARSCGSESAKSVSMVSPGSGKKKKYKDPDSIQDKLYNENYFL